MAINGEIVVSLNMEQTGSHDFGGPLLEADMRALLQLTDGTGVNQADRLFIDQRTVASASNDDLDLAGVLADALGATITFAEIVAIFIINAPKTGNANTTDLTVGLGTNPFVGFLGGTTPTMGPLKPGAFAMIGGGGAAGIGTVGAGSSDILRIANSSGAPATYQIAIVGRSA